MSGYVNKMSMSASIEERLSFLQAQIEQLNKKLEESRQEVASLKRVVDPEIKTRRLFDLIREVNGHTSKMPDMSGYNTDHDRRYLMRGESALSEFSYFGTGGMRLWRIGVEGGNLVVRFDKNLGVGTPDWSGDPYTSYPPNFD